MSIIINILKVIALLWTGVVLGTAWKSETVPDPIVQGKSCQTWKRVSIRPGHFRDEMELAGMSRSPLVNCAHSGYIGFRDDYDELSHNERVQIREFLMLMDKITDFEDLSEVGGIWFIEQIYARRDQGDNQKIRTKRRLELLLEGAIDAIQYEVMELVSASDKGEREFLEGEYSRRVGDYSEACEKWKDMRNKETIESDYSMNMRTIMLFDIEIIGECPSLAKDVGISDDIIESAKDILHERKTSVEEGVEE